MADTDTQIPNTADAIADLQRQLAQTAPTIPTGSPDDGTSPSWTGLLGRVLGGAPAGYQMRGGEADAAGNRALLNFGINMLLASGPHAVRPNVLSSLATGLQGAQESVGQDQRSAAALAAAQYQAAREARQDQLARIKEAIPLLQLQVNQRAVGALPATLGGAAPGTSIATGGSIGPPDINSPAGEVAKRTAAFWAGQGLTPEQVAGVMAAGPGAESSFNPTATGDDGASHGMYQHQGDRWAEMTKRYGPNPTEAQQHAFAAWEISPEGPRAAVGAQLRAAKTPEEAARIWTTGFEAPKNAEAEAAKRASAAGRYVGYGQPPPGQASAPAMAPGAGARPALPPPEAPMAPGAGGAQTAGPAVPTSGVIPALSPEQAARSAADVEAIKAGMIGAGANPTTLAPGGGSAPAPMPGAVITAQAPGSALASAPPLPPGVDPNSREAFGILHPIVPSAEERALFNKGLTTEQQQAHDTQLQALQQQYQTARMRGDPAAMAAVQEKLVTLETATSTLRENARKLGTEREANFYEKRQAALDAAHAAEQTDRRAQAAAQQLQQRKLDEIATTAKEARDTEAAKQEGQYILDDRKDMAKTRDAARQSIDQVHVLRALSDRAGTATSLESITLPNGQTMRDVMVQNGLGSETTLAHLNAQQAYEAAATQMVLDLRKGVQMGSLSDRDLAAVQKLVPKGSTTAEGRANILATIEQAHARNRDYIDRVHQLWDQGNGMSWEKAKVAADKQMGDIVTQVPQEYKTMTPEQRADWFKTYAPPRALIRTMDEVDNTGKVTRRGHIIQVPEAPQ